MRFYITMYALSGRVRSSSSASTFPPSRKALPRRSSHSTATGGDGERPANRSHRVSIECGHIAAQIVLPHRLDVVQIDGAGAFHSMLDADWHFARDPVPSRSNRRNHHGSNQINGVLATQNQDWPPLVWVPERVKPHVAARYFSGHACASGQGPTSSSVGAFFPYPRR